MKTPGDKPAPRPQIGIHFKCCNVYARIFLTKDETAYAGNCPRCARAIRIRTAEGGEPSRFWTVE